MGKSKTTTEHILEMFSTMTVEGTVVILPIVGPTIVDHHRPFKPLPVLLGQEINFKMRAKDGRLWSVKMEAAV